jgi:hypothetical protein
MSQPKGSGAATDPETKETDAADQVEEADTLSPLDPEVEAPINAAVPLEERQGTEGG